MKKTIYILLFCYATIATLTIIFFDGTGDAGDSICHYLFAKYAPDHPKLFFDHWAKPVYVLLACPFAQFGFIGIKVFNAIVTLVTIFFTYRIAQKLDFKNSTLSVVIMLCAPLYYILTFSGLTEPLFAMVIAVCIFLCVKQKYVTACLIISFLPFVRSEGLVIVGVFAIYFLVKKRWKILPLLLFGHLVYSTAGYFVYHDFLWVFNRIPYIELRSTYGSGKPFHFVEQLLYVVGVPIYILFWIGFINIIWEMIKNKQVDKQKILIWLSFTCFFIAHSLFWYLGIFNSMGLKRVLIGVMPMIALISLQGFNFLTMYFPEDKKAFKIIFQTLIIGYIIIFTLSSNPTAIHWQRDLMLSDSQLSAARSADFIKNKIGLTHRIICADPYMCELLNIDFFDESQRINLSKINLAHLQPGDIVVWENWFALHDADLKKEVLDNNGNLISLYASRIGNDNNESLYCVYQKK